MKWDVVTDRELAEQAIKQWFDEIAEATGFSLREAIIRAEKKVM